MVILCDSTLHEKKEFLVLDMGMKVENFLRDHWQKKPLFIKGGIKDFKSPFSANELAGLACEEGVESRLVIENGKVPWELITGPLDESTLESLPEENWTLLVQDVDKWISELSGLKSLFRFVPDWRFDDVMVSYGPRGGSVGAHLDHYDVFLLQVSGTKKWSIESQMRQKGDDEYVEGIKLRQLKTFKPDLEFVLGPGDLLYLPPRTPHHGVTLDPGMTFSIGFYAPTYKEILQNHFDYCLKKLDDDERFTDPNPVTLSHPAEITSATIDKVRLLLEELSRSYDGLPHWFGALLSSQKGHCASHSQTIRPTEPLTWKTCLNKLENFQAILRDESCRMNFIEQDNEVLFFVNGIEIICPISFLKIIKLISGSLIIDSYKIIDEIRTDPAAQNFFLDLVNQGYFYWE